MKVIQFELPDQIATELETLVKDGGFTGESEIMHLALAEFVHHRHFLPRQEITSSQKMTLKIVLEPSDEGGYTVYVPALPGCISEGDTVEESLTNIQEAIELYLKPVEDDWIFEEGILVKELVL